MKLQIMKRFAASNLLDDMLCFKFSYAKEFGFLWHY